MKESFPQKPSPSLIERMQAREAVADSDPTKISERKKTLEAVLTVLTEQRTEVVELFKTIAEAAAGVTTKETALYVVGGNAFGKEMSEESDVDIVFACDPPMRAFSKKGLLATIPLSVRREIIDTLRPQVYEFVQSKLPASINLVAEGLLEIKGYGEQTPEELETRKEEFRDVERL